MSTVGSRHVNCPLLSSLALARQRQNIAQCVVSYHHWRNGAVLKQPQSIYSRASLMPAVAVTSALGANTYVAALRGLSVGCFSIQGQTLHFHGILFLRSGTCPSGHFRVTGKVLGGATKGEAQPCRVCSGARPLKHSRNFLPPTWSSILHPSRQ